MLRNYTLAAGLAATTLALVAVACGGSTETAGTGGAGGGTPSYEPIVPPASNPNGAAPDGMASTTYAISKLFLGDTNRDGSANKLNGWKQYGYDLDGTVSTAESSNLCKPRSGGSAKSVYPDGDQGIDNSFGKNILPIITGIASDASVKVNEGIADGSFTIMLDLEKLGAGTDYNGILTKLYGGSSLGAAPKWDGTDMWPVIPELLKDPTDITSAQVQFPQSYVVENTWVSGSKGDVSLTLSISGFSLNLTISSALISMKLDPDHKGAMEGVIAGVLATDTLTSELKKVAGAFDPSLCSGSTIDSIITQIEQASDIMKDGTQNASAECDGISIGLGFEAKTVQLGAIGPAATGGSDPCAAGGGGAGGAMP